MSDNEHFNYDPQDEPAIDLPANDEGPMQGPGPTEAVVVHQHGAVGLFGAVGPVEVIEKATQVATALKAVIKTQGLISNIQGREYPRCEAWTLLGTMLGVFPVLVWTREIPGGWEARVEARTRDGAIVGAAEAECLKIEKNWQDRDAYAVRSMAQTRATAKALRMPLGFVMTLAGYEPTPAEEMPQTPEKAPGAIPRPGVPSRQAPAPKASPAPQSAKPAIATDATRAWMAQNLEPCMQEALAFFIELGIILPNETIEDVPLKYVPISKTEMVSLVAKITKFAIHGQAEKLVPHEAPGEITEPPKPKPDNELNEARPEWYLDIIVPVPRKGMKREDYLRNPDTIGSLYEMRHGDDEESQAARQRLYGFLHNFEPKSWIDRQGQTRMPSKADVEFRRALDALAEAMEKTGEKL